MDKNPSKPEGEFRREITILETNGNIAGAAKLAVEAMASFPLQADFPFFFASFAVVDGFPEKAASALELGLKLSPAHPGLRRLELQWFGVSIIKCFRDGEFDRAFDLQLRGADRAFSTLSQIAFDRENAELAYSAAGFIFLQVSKEQHARGLNASDVRRNIRKAIDCYEASIRLNPADSGDKINLEGAQDFEREIGP